MYSYPQYKEKDRARIISFMREHPFVMLIGCDNNKRIECTQIPVLIDERDGRLFISGHIARKLAHETALIENPEALIVFTGPHSYISATWYTGDPHLASTWNYISVHARGKVKWTDENGLIEFLKRFTLHFENNNPGSSTVYDNLPDEYKERLIKAIVGFEMEVIELDNVHKISQNRDEKSYHSIIEHLEQQNESGKYIAARMRERAAEIFQQ